MSPKNSDNNNNNDDINKSNKSELHEFFLQEVIDEVNAITDLWLIVPKKPKINDERSSVSLRDALDYLRICIKYSLFERDALQREVKYLKELVKELGGKL